MTVAVIKTLTKRIRVRMGSTEAAARAADVSPGVWSGYENADKPETTIPVGRLLGMALTSAERREIVALFTEPEDATVEDLMGASAEATEAAADVLRLVRMATRDGVVTETEARSIRAASMEANAKMDGVLRSVG